MRTGQDHVPNKQTCPWGTAVCPINRRRIVVGRSLGVHISWGDTGTQDTRECSPFTAGTNRSGTGSRTLPCPSARCLRGSQHTVTITTSTQSHCMHRMSIPPASSSPSVDHSALLKSLLLLKVTACTERQFLRHQVHRPPSLLHVSQKTLFPWRVITSVFTRHVSTRHCSLDSPSTMSWSFQGSFSE